MANQNDRSWPRLHPRYRSVAAEAGIKGVAAAQRKLAAVMKGENGDFKVATFFLDAAAERLGIPFRLLQQSDDGLLVEPAEALAGRYLEAVLEKDGVEDARDFLGALEELRLLQVAELFPLCQRVLDAAVDALKRGAVEAAA